MSTSSSSTNGLLLCVAFLHNCGSIWRVEKLLQKRKVTKQRKCVLAVTHTQADFGQPMSIKKPETKRVVQVVDQAASGLQFELPDRKCLG